MFDILRAQQPDREPHFSTRVFATEKMDPRMFFSAREGNEHLGVVVFGGGCLWFVCSDICVPPCLPSV